jgi:hypothetical protein
MQNDGEKLKFISLKWTWAAIGFRDVWQRVMEFSSQIVDLFFVSEFISTHSGHHSLFLTPETWEMI